MYYVTFYSPYNGGCVGPQLSFNTISDIKRVKRVKKYSKISKFYVDQKVHCVTIGPEIPSTVSDYNVLISSLPQKYIKVAEDLVSRISFKVSIHYHNPFSSAKISTFACMMVSCETFQEFVDFMKEFPIQLPYPKIMRPNFLSYGKSSRYIINTSPTTTTNRITDTYTYADDSTTTNGTLQRTVIDHSLQGAVIDFLNTKITELNSVLDMKPNG